MNSILTLKTCVKVAILSIEPARQNFFFKILAKYVSSIWKLPSPRRDRGPEGAQTDFSTIEVVMQVIKMGMCTGNSNSYEPFAGRRGREEVLKNMIYHFKSSIIQVLENGT